MDPIGRIQHLIIMATHYIKRGDRPTATDTLTRNGSAINLTGSTVSLIIQNQDTGKTYKRSATIVSAAAGTVSYAFVADDSAISGTYKLEWEITPGSGAIETVPNNGWINLEILADLG